MAREVVRRVDARVREPRRERTEQRPEREVLRGKLERDIVELFLRALLRVLAAVLAVKAEHDAVDDVRCVGLRWAVEAGAYRGDGAAALHRPLVLDRREHLLAVVEDVVAVMGQDADARVRTIGLDEQYDDLGARHPTERQTLVERD